METGGAERRVATGDSRPPANVGGGSVLIIDADDATRADVAHAMRGLVLRTVEAANGEEGLKRLAAQPDGFDAIVVAVDLSGTITSGFEVVRRVKRTSSTAGIPVLFLTNAEVSEADVVRAADYGAVDLLTKPIVPAILAAKIRGAVSQARLVRQLRAELAFAERHALVDPLTGLSNRRHLEMRVLEESAYSKRHRETFAVVMLDLDHFKLVNDTYGHDEGDHVLTAFAAALGTVLRSEDVAFRYGGEEFVLLLRACESKRALEVAGRLRAHLHAHPHCFPDGTTRPVTFSGGTSAALASEGFAGDELITRADEALYTAKRGGRDRVEVWQRTTSSKQMLAVKPPEEPTRADASTRALLQALREARVLISSQDRWVAQGYAQDREGRWRPVGSDDAARFSVLGAIVRVSGGSRDVTAASRRALQEAAPDLYSKMSSPRETLTHEEALTLLDRAVTYLQARATTPRPFAAGG